MLSTGLELATCQFWKVTVTKVITEIITKASRSSQHKTSGKDDQVASVEHDQYLGGRRSQHFTDSHLFPAVLALEYNQAKYPDNGDKDRNNAEQSDQVADLQFPFVCLLQDLVIECSFERINRIYLC